METKGTGNRQPGYCTNIYVALCGVTDCIGFNWLQDQATLLVNLHIPSVMQCSMACLTQLPLSA
jgi:hypothetical protein